MLIYLREMFEAEMDRTVDGDTVDVIKLPPVRLRMLGYNAAETNRGPEETRSLGREQGAWVDDWFRDHAELIIDDRGPDPFGRRLAWIYCKKSLECLNFAFVKKWPGTARNPRHMAAEIFDLPVTQTDSYRPDRSMTKKGGEAA